MPVSLIRLSIPQSLKSLSTTSMLLSISGAATVSQTPSYTISSLLIISLSNFTQTIILEPKGFHSTRPVPEKPLSPLPFISSIVRLYSPMATTLPLNSEASLVVGVLSLISTCASHWKYCWLRRWARAKSTTLSFPVKPTECPFLTTGRMRSNM